MATILKSPALTPIRRWSQTGGLQHLECNEIHISSNALVGFIFILQVAF